MGFLSSLSLFSRGIRLNTETYGIIGRVGLRGVPGLDVQNGDFFEELEQWNKKSQ